ncbi:MAG: hypothetical protein IJY04_08945, partial [Clostridia bacterium]|nr:hypothetical protein [Clostridia bacterium]
YDLLIAYAGMPNDIAASTKNLTSVSKNKTRYKGKMFNTSPPKDYALWEEICYEYTRHLIERYGIDTVSSWRLQCFNEPDIPAFFMSELPDGRDAERAEAYCKMYKGFTLGISRASEKLKRGGPALAYRREFLGMLLDYVKKNDLKLDFISLHNYGVTPDELNSGTKRISVANNLKKHEDYMQTIRAHGFGDTEIIIDEWGAATAGFFNKEECPALIFRETEVFSAYYAKLIHSLVYSDYNIDKLIICLSGQHEMTEDFSGFRNFFTLNFIKKPIYNAFILASRLGETLLECENSEENVHVIPTKAKNGSYAVLISYSDEHFTEDIPQKEITVHFDGAITATKATVTCIDKTTANPYSLYNTLKIGIPSEKEISLLREEGEMKAKTLPVANGSITVTLTPNCTCLITL